MLEDGKLPFVTIATSHYCNFRCPHCYVSTAHRPELSTQEIINIIDQIAQAGYIGLRFSGGEVFLRQDFPEIYRHIKKRGLLTRIFTNGFLLTPLIIDLLEDLPPAIIHVSFYGMSEQTYRRVTRTTGSFQKVINNIELLLERGFGLVLNTLVTQQNKHDLDKMQDYAQKLGVILVVRYRIFPREHDHGTLGELRVSPPEVVDLDLKVDRLKPGREHYDCKNRLFYCLPTWNSLHINAYGRLTLCPHFRGISCDLRQISFREARDTLLHRLSSMKLDQSHCCFNCPHYGNLCYVCPATIRDPESVSYYCQVARLRAKVCRYV